MSFVNRDPSPFVHGGTTVPTPPAASNPSPASNTPANLPFDNHERVEIVPFNSSAKRDNALGGAPPPGTAHPDELLRGDPVELDHGGGIAGRSRGNGADPSAGAAGAVAARGGHGQTRANRSGAEVEQVGRDGAADFDTDTAAPARGSTKIDPSVTGFEQLRDQFLGGVAPQVLNPKLEDGGVRLGIVGNFANLYNEKLHVPIYSAQRLTPERIAAAMQVERSKAKFQDDPALPNEKTIKSYVGFTDEFDHGHLATAGFSATGELNKNTFRNTNIFAQYKWHNERLWAGIEDAAALMALPTDMKNHNGHAGLGHNVDLLTGVSFIGDQIKFIGGPYTDDKGKDIDAPWLPVPTHVWKAVWDEKTQSGGVYWTENKDPADANEAREWEKNHFKGHYEIISFAEFTKRSGIDPMPSLTKEQKERAPNLPPPEQPAHPARWVPITSEPAPDANPTLAGAAHADESF